MSLTDKLLERSIVTCHDCGRMLPYVKAIQEFGLFFCADCYDKSFEDEEDGDELL